jgi:hypothetical protein
MQTDVLASVPITASGQFTDQATTNLARCRVKSIYIVPLAQRVVLFLGTADRVVRLKQQLILLPPLLNQPICCSPARDWCFKPPYMER